jgi:hypothetical protein
VWGGGDFGCRRLTHAGSGGQFFATVLVPELQDEAPVLTDRIDRVTAVHLAVERNGSALASGNTSFIARHKRPLLACADRRQ